MSKGTFQFSEVDYQQLNGVGSHTTVAEGKEMKNPGPGEHLEYIDPSNATTSISGIGIQDKLPTTRNILSIVSSLGILGLVSYTSSAG